MCGLAGIVRFAGSRVVEDSVLTNMRDAMIHRGPDGGANWISPDGQVGLAHRRLSIIDLSVQASQPMSNYDDSSWVVFNGEIYNHAEIRRELILGCDTNWKTDHSDTEVILHAYDRWGSDSLARLRGMFAIAVWDVRRKRLLLARDRFGVKPLYYAHLGNEFVFASEIKALLRHPRVSKVVNAQAVADYLTFIATPAPETMFKGIHKVPNGCLVTVNGEGEVCVERWYEVWDHTRDLTAASTSQLEEAILAELSEAVRLRKVSDVPVGVFLSGGVDSSTNVALFSENAGEVVRTFSIGYDKDYRSYSNEFEYANLVARRFGTQHHERRISLSELQGFLPRMIYLQDEPIADPVCVPLYFLSELARQNGVIVCQAGEGADELFLGYENWITKLRLQRLAQAVNSQPQLLAATSGALRLLGLGLRKPADAVRRAADGRPIFWGTTEAFTQAEKEVLLEGTPGQAEIQSAWHAIEPVWRRFRDQAWERSPLHWMTFCDLQTRIPELLLMRLDRMTMGASVEAREPYLDHRVVELALSIPQARTAISGRTKPLFRDAIKGLIPEQVLSRRKQGFGVPITEWLIGQLGAEVRATVSRFCARSGLLNMTGIERVMRGNSDDRWWYLYNLAMWWEATIE